MKKSRYLPIADVLRTDAATFAHGDAFSIDPSSPGKALKAGYKGYW